MKKLFVLSAALFLSVPSFAKITIFSGRDALKHVLDSQELAAVLAQKPGVDISEVKVAKEGQAPKLRFALTFRLVRPALGLHGPTSAPCFLKAETSMEVYQATSPTGGTITGSRLTKPTFGPLVCAEPADERD